ncbi:MAG: PilZ domain-containing protein [Planctomycetaceae bacterium]|nr:PilZ domain-containing protein [Planctomycetaceae bacterium]
MSTATLSIRDKQAVRVINMLKTWSDRLSGHVTQKRAHVRKDLVTKLMIIIPESSQEAGESQDRSMIEVWSRNISRGGICIISDGKLKTNTDTVIVGVGNKFMESEIVRNRQVHDGFWEYGLMFIQEIQM